ncbi:phage minor capsid protein, partial [Salmonella enterica]|uniref:phage minor capsid protein n=1 Tax=Salmonella enterica TaxID=28901 RepID=UPI003CEFA937
EACARIQGNVVDLRPVGQVPPGSPYKSIYNPVWDARYKQPDGHHGINCSHPHRPFDPEFNEIHADPIEPDEAIALEKVYQRRNELA